ncbi:MAG: filamentous hemagglutinin N-terminal domain-containing protein, partial [Cyanobacteria bacterium P01_F01_bin.153]
LTEDEIVEIYQAQDGIRYNDEDGTETVIRVDNNRLDIDGGRLSSDGANLFHSFRQFGLNEGQIANFLSQPDVRNILGRVTGGEVSIIDGLIQVTGGDSNLYLTNPAGMVFGPNARLDVPGSFMATTSTAIGFGDGNWFNAFGANDFSSLVGTPTDFAFGALGQAGSLVNLGELAVSQGEHLALSSGAVINLGTLEASGGRITVAAVPNQRLVRFTQEGQVLSLEVPVDRLVDFDARSLPAALSGDEAIYANELTVDSQGRVVLVHSGAATDAAPGTVIASGQLDASGDRGGRISVLGDRVGLVAAEVDASGAEQGGTVEIGGGFRGEGDVFNAQQTVVDRRSRINASAEMAGNGGQAIIWSDDTTRFAGTVAARGGATFGDGGLVEISGRQRLSFSGGADASAAAGQNGMVLFDPTNIRIVDDGASASPTATEGLIPEVDPSAPDPDNPLSDGEITAADVFIDAGGDTFEEFVIARSTLEALEGNVTLEASNNITIEDMSGDRLSFQAEAGETVLFSAGNAFSMDPSDTIEVQGGNVDVSASKINVGNFSSQGGDITLTGTVLMQSDVTIDARDNGLTGETANGTITINGNVLSTNEIERHAIYVLSDQGAITFTGNIGSAEGQRPAKLDVKSKGDVA